MLNALMYIPTAVFRSTSLERPEKLPAPRTDGCPISSLFPIAAIALHTLAKKHIANDS